MDGISRYSLNITNDKSSSELTDAAKLVALKEDAQIIKNIEQSQKKKHDKRKKLEENENEEKLIISYEYVDENDKNNDSNGQNSEFYNTEIEKIYGEYDKDDLKLNLNKDGQTVEIIDIVNNKVVATIDIERLSDIIKHLKIPKSMLINRKV